MVLDVNYKTIHKFLL